VEEGDKNKGQLNRANKTGVERARNHFSLAEKAGEANLTIYVSLELYPSQSAGNEPLFILDAVSVRLGPSAAQWVAKTAIPKTRSFLFFFLVSSPSFPSSCFGLLLP
jgi:hypothetical protein